MTWAAVAGEGGKLRGGHPSTEMCRRVLKSFDVKAGRRKYKYGKCGRKPWKLTACVKQYLVRKLLALRVKTICTAATLQRELARDKQVHVEVSSICKFLKSKGYRWLPRAQKPRYNARDKADRLAFANRMLSMSPRAFACHFDMAMDGVVLTLPPREATERENYCRAGDTHMWRKSSEAAKPELSGKQPYHKQIPAARAVPMWGGIGTAGFGLVVFHPQKKLCTAEWVAAANAGKLVQACKDASGKRSGPFRVLCDNETFLSAAASKAVHARKRVALSHIPARSPDLNPVEKFWGWVRKRLRAMDLRDLQAKRPPISRTALKHRVRSLVRGAAARRVAKSYMLGLRSTCSEVSRKRGAASRG